LEADPLNDTTSLPSTRLLNTRTYESKDSSWISSKISYLHSTTQQHSNGHIVVIIIIIIIIIRRRRRRRITIIT